MKRLITHIVYLAALLGALLMPANGRAGGVVTGKQQGELCIDRYDGHLRLVTEERQRPTTVQNGRQSERVGSSRPTRLLPTHGPKPSRGVGRWMDSLSSNLIKYDFLRLVVGRLSAGRGAASPRSYYVIALRRILC